jgi:Ankyrin repeat.
MKALALLLAHATMEQVNSCVSARDLRTPLHLACAMGNLSVAQLLLWVRIIYFLSIYVVMNIITYKKEKKEETLTEKMIRSPDERHI